MEVTKELLEQRIVEYTQAREKALATANACTGAIEDAKGLLAILNQESQSPLEVVTHE